MKNSKIYAALIALTLILCFTSCNTSSSTPGDTVMELFDLIKNKEFGKTAGMHVTKDGEKITGKDAEKMNGFAEMAYAQFEEKDGIKNVAIEKETISEDGLSAEVEFTTHFNNGDSDKQDAKLLNKNGKWFIKL